MTARRTTRDPSPTPTRLDRPPAAKVLQRPVAAWFAEWKARATAAPAAAEPAPAPAPAARPVPTWAEMFAD